ncbi:MAG TPA: antibiotic biosynthesis monooxygenase [Acidimicrobiales bacterium]|jgi:antibiotic biosynthesis monooxygenase (ABM) superfamily enzyme|nr:antibiotic biosynthesis monooxygenase [Acidimicrobiales bacterium]
MNEGVDALPDGTEGPVTTTVTRRVKPGHEPFYEQFLEGINAAASRFPGHLGVEVFRPESASAGDYRIVYRFDTGEHLRAWLESDQRAAWLQRAEPHVIGPMRTQFLTGLETWFTLSGRQGTPPPPPYKMALLTWITIFPLITLVVVALEPLIDGLSLVPRLAVTTAVTVPIMTWLVMPRVTRLLRAWLYPDR